LNNKNESDKKIDCSGFCCSMPLVEARYKLDKMKVGETLEVIATCPSSKEDMQTLTRLEKFELIENWIDRGKYHFIIKKVQ
jgi:tRNA 2-thiouridine synthesizing protein A